MLNKILLIGQLVSDPEMTYTDRGIAVTRFVLDIPQPAGKGETDRFQVVAWNKVAETCFGQLNKGSQAYLEGRLRLSRRPGKEVLPEVLLQDMKILSTPKVEGQKIDLDFLTAGEEEDIFP